jgi:ribonuclease BN (tRNA processing enzyme)
MKVTLLGTGTSLPVADRVQSGILIEASDLAVLFDIGSGVLHRLTQTKTPITSISHIFISHFHVDHCSDFMTLCQSLWLTKYDKVLNVYGPPQVMAWSQSLQDDLFPYLKHKITTRFVPLEGETTTSLNDVSVRTCPAVHGSTKALALRLDCGGRSVFFSSDTAPGDEACSLAKGVDVMIHECFWLDGEHPKGIHTSPSELARVVQECVPSRVVLTHVGPDVASEERKVVSIVRGISDSNVIMGRDLMSFTV